MTMTKSAAFDAGIRAGMEMEQIKTAYGPEEAARVLALAKARQLPKASSRIIPMLAGGPSAANAARTLRRGLTELGIPSELVQNAVSDLKQSPITNITARTGKPTIFPGAGNLMASIREALGGKQMPDVPTNQRRMLHSVLKGHELDEATVPGALGAGHFGHRSPDVIFREHNRIVTMPRGNEAVQDYMRSMREGREAAGLFPAGLQYGRGERLSRHARKRLTDRAGGVLRRELEALPKKPWE